MKTINQVAGLRRVPVCGCIVLLFFCLAVEGLFAGAPSPGSGGGPNGQLTSWSFADTNNWLTDAGHAPIAFTNIENVTASYGRALQLDSTNVAFLQYKVVETDNTTNLTVDTGCLTFWFQPSWSSATQGGTGPNVPGRFIEVGAYTTNSAVGWWSLYLDEGGTNIYFSGQTNSGGGTGTNYLSAPISWTSNQWHFIALNYSATNTALFIDGSAVTNGPGVSVLPGAAVLADGFFIGSDSNGVLQAHGEFGGITTYKAELDTNLINGTFNMYGLFYLGPSSFPFLDAPSSPGYSAYGYNVIGGPGYVQYVTNGSFPTGGQVYFTNMSASVATNFTTTFNFSVAGGTNGVPYDLFGTAALANPAKNAQWSWLGQVYTGGVYTLTNQPNYTACYILGTPQDSNHGGITDTYQLFVSHTDPNGSGFDTSGIPIAWEVLEGLNPETPNLGNLDPDMDGLINLKEYLYGTRPLVSEGFNIWVANPAGISGIP